jgi:hypothetical protein
MKVDSTKVFDRNRLQFMNWAIGSEDQIKTDNFVTVVDDNNEWANMSFLSNMALKDVKN